jgi:hypothetical protein
LRAKQCPCPRSRPRGFSVGRSEVTPSGRTRLFELRHSFAGATGVPAQQPLYAAPPIRSATLRRQAASGTLSYELARLAPVGVLGDHGRTRSRGRTGAPSCCGRRDRVGPPRHPVSEHGPAPHEKFPGDGNDGLFLAGLSPAQPLVDGRCPRVVSQSGPGALDQELAQHRRSALGDPPTPSSSPDWYCRGTRPP